MTFFSGVLITLNGVQRRRLARSGRPGDQHRAVGLVDRTLEALVLAHPQAVEVHDHRLLVEDAHDDRLAVHARQRHDAQVDVVAVDAQPDAPVLRDAALGVGSAMTLIRLTTPATIERGTTVDSTSTPSTRRRAHAVGLGLQVDVRRALLHRLGDDLVGELDDRRVVDGLAQVDDLPGRTRARGRRRGR